MENIVSKGSDPGGTVESVEQRESRRRLRLRWPRLRPDTSDDDAYVRRWKQSWTRGAQARWRGAVSGDNPHRAGSAAARAWEAGWAWAEQQPDRRTPSIVRFAVPHRRADDRLWTLRRSARAGAVGLSVFAVAGWLWQARRRSG